ncbi:hypothetical protein Goari_009594, partial [Gossypium aridum]|nr:hypothetical protein [Gossypium aridum]
MRLILKGLLLGLHGFSIIIYLFFKKYLSEGIQ